MIEYALSESCLYVYVHYFRASELAMAAVEKTLYEMITITGRHPQFLTDTRPYLFSYFRMLVTQRYGRGQPVQRKTFVY